MVRAGVWESGLQGSIPGIAIDSVTLVKSLQPMFPGWAASFGGLSFWEPNLSPLRKYSISAVQWGTVGLQVA